MKIEAINNNNFKLREEIEEIFPPTWNITIQELQKDNWKNRKRLINIFKYEDQLWKYMKDNNITPKEIIIEIEKTAVVY